MAINHPSIRDFVNRMVISGEYIITDIRFSVSRSGNAYMTATLTDATGSIGMVCWDVDGSVNPSMNGGIVAVCGTVGTYREEFQLNVEQIKVLALDSLDAEDMAAIIPTAPINLNAYNQYVYNIVQSMANPGIRAICNELLSRNWDRFSSIPAGMNVHHTFRGGLLMHTADMVSLAETLLAENHNAVNRDLLLGGVLLHDIGKLREFVTSPVTGLVTGYSEEGNLLGHSVLGAMMIAEAGARLNISPKLTLLLEHMVLSHHGNPASGAAKEPMTIEAEILHDLDKLDSRRQSCVEKLAVVSPGSFTVQVPVLGRRLYRHGIVETNAPEQQDEDWPEEEECWEDVCADDGEEDDWGQPFDCEDEDEFDFDQESAPFCGSPYPAEYRSFPGVFNGEAFSPGFPEDPAF